jgi:hypothetical protein
MGENPGMSTWLGIPLLLFALGVGLSGAHAADITACGTTVAAADTGVLQADLDCSTSPFGVRLLARATLDLNGHTIAGGDATVATVAGVRGPSTTNPVGRGTGDFTIVGPGVISGTNHPPFTSQGTDACVLVNHGRARITSALGVVEIRGCVHGIRGARRFTGSGDFYAAGASAGGRIRMDHVTLTDNFQAGLAASEVIATDVMADGNGDVGMGANRRMTLTNVTANDNDGIGLFAAKLMEGTDVTAMNNGNNGLDVCGFRGRLRLTNVLATGNGLFGVCGDRVQLTDATVIDNVTADVTALLAAPVLINTTCGTSLRQDSGTWGVCAND